MYKKILLIPRSAFGDNLYASLWLCYLIEIGRIKDGFLICAPKYRTLVSEFKEIHCYTGTTVLNKGHATWSLCGEVAFWYSLLKCYKIPILSIFNDIIDLIFCKITHSELIACNIIGNYFFLFKIGLRHLINNQSKHLFRFQCDINPKHFMHRIEFISNLKFDQKDGLVKSGIRSYFRKHFLISEISCISRGDIVVTPEAGASLRDITLQQIKKISLLYESYKIRVYVSDPNHIKYSELNNISNIKLLPFPCLADFVTILSLAKIVFSADSYPAHLSGLSGTTTLVLYNSPQFPKYAEYWGSPYENVYHLEGGCLYQLDTNYTANQVSIISSHILYKFIYC